MPGMLNESFKKDAPVCAEYMNKLDDPRSSLVTLLPAIVSTRCLCDCETRVLAYASFLLLSSGGPLADTELRLDFPRRYCSVLFNEDMNYYKNYSNDSRR